MVELESRTIRREPLGVLLRREHPLASGPAIDVADLGEEMLLMHSREANPGHFDAIVQLCRDRGMEPRVRLRTLSFDPAQTPLVRGEAVAIVGSSAQVGQPAGLVWLPIEPPAAMDIGIVARRYGRPPALDRLLETAAAVAAELGWLDR
jgi:hypothetical protein